VLPEFDWSDIDTTIHGPVRLGILTALSVDGPMTFTELKKRLNVTDGALGLHLKRLEELSYLGADKQLIGKRPQSTYHLMTDGRLAFRRYISVMRSILDAVEDADPS